MGNYINKYFSHNAEIYNNETEKEETKDSIPTSEVTVTKDIQTPPIHKRLPIDPRSVTSGISRTPIQVNSTPVGLSKRISAIPRHLQTKTYLETDIDKVMLCLTPKKSFTPKVREATELQFPEVQDKNAEILLTPTPNNLNGKKIISAIEKERYDILGLDPRSPAADFDRTPILMPKSIERLRARSQECLQRLGSYDTDVYYPRFSYCEMSSQFNVTEVQALPNLATCEVKSLNSVSTDSNDKSSEPESPSSSYSSRTENVSEAEKEVGDQKVFEGILEQGNCNDMNVKKSTQQQEKCDAENDIIKVWRDSLVLDEPQEFETNESDNMLNVHKRASQIAKEEVIITFDDDSIVKDTLSPKSDNFESEKIKVDTIVKKKKILKSEAKITTDEKKIFNPNEKNGSESTKTRTPLGNRSNNGQMQTLLLNSPQQIFRNKGITPRMFQENTPPHKKYVAKSKLSGIQWDPDSTVII